MKRTEFQIDISPAPTKTPFRELRKQTEAKPTVTPELLQALRSGDQNAFERIYLHYVSSVKNFLTVLTRSGEAGEEITQEVFVTLWEKRDRIDPDKNISAYIYTIAKNYAFKYFNRKKGLLQEDVMSADSLEAYGSPDEILIQKEKEILIEIAVSQMPPQRRKIYRLSRIEGLSNSEIAEMLNISKNTVENHITSALNDLREVLAMFLLLVLLK